MKRKSQKKFRLPGSTGVWILFLAILMIELLFYTWCRVQCVETGYQIAQTKEDYQHLVTLQKNLIIGLARLKQPERIAKVAAEKLG